MILKTNKFINFLIIISTFIIILNFLFFVIEKSPVQYSDWLINYQGGFVRRGLPGEIFYQLNRFTSVPLDLVVFISVSLLYIFFAINFIKLAQKIKFNFINLLVFFSPLSFLYPLMEQKISGRKDIIFIFLIIFLVTYLEKLNFKNQKYLIILFILISTFSHTGFFVYVPIFFLIFIILNYRIPFKKIFIELMIISIFSMFFFFLILFNTSIDQNSINNICTSLKEYLPDCGKSDYIETLNWSLKYEIELVTKIWNKENYIPFYSIAFLLANLPLMLVFFKSRLNKKYIFNLNPVFIFIIISFFTFPIYFIGADYGRYMHLTYLSLLICYFKGISTKFIIVKNQNYNNIRKSIMFLIIFLYGFTWSIPHCCNNNFKFIYQKPLSKFININ